ncbi:MAG: DUF983 domain-containing protein [Lunatimonas sp.]|nr:DUF983 domain-containing protein [Lunatimonas sp.]
MNSPKIDRTKERAALFPSLLGCKCPVCTRGQMFRSSALDMRNFNELNKQCAVCGYDFMPEPGFYQISLFITYAFGVAIFVVFGVLTYLIFESPKLWHYYLMIFIPAVLFTPWNVRYSKVLMLYAFVWRRKV